MKITPTTILEKRTRHLLEASLHQQTILLHIKTGMYHAMNETASLLWSLLDKPGSAFSLSQQLSKLSGHCAEDLEIDVLNWLQDSLINQLIKPASSQQTISNNHQPTMLHKLNHQYAPPYYRSFDALSAIHGNNATFETDNLETGS